MSRFGSWVRRSKSAHPYSILAPLYDRIMAHVDYDRWADYLLSLSARYFGSPRAVLELGCGTGNLTFRLYGELRCPYLATDYSKEMLAEAEKKVAADTGALRFQTADFGRLEVEGRFDLIVLAYDGINYLLEEEEVVRLFEDTASLLNPGGIFLFDQSTPENSINNLAYFSDRWESDGEGYVRKSRYEADQRLHITRFDIRTGGRRWREVHFQRAYDRQEMELMIKLSSLRVEDCFDAFSFLPATMESERIQWVLSKRRTTD